MSLGGNPRREARKKGGWVRAARRRRGEIKILDVLDGGRRSHPLRIMSSD